MSNPLSQVIDAWFTSAHAPGRASLATMRAQAVRLEGDLARERTLREEAERAYLAVALASGAVHHQSMGPVIPGSVSEIVDAFQRETIAAIEDRDHAVALLHLVYEMREHALRGRIANQRAELRRLNVDVKALQDRVRWGLRPIPELALVARDGGNRQADTCPICTDPAPCAYGCEIEDAARRRVTEEAACINPECDDEATEDGMCARCAQWGRDVLDDVARRDPVACVASAAALVKHMQSAPHDEDEEDGCVALIRSDVLADVLKCSPDQVVEAARLLVAAKEGQRIAYEAQLDSVADALGEERMLASDGYHGHAVARLVEAHATVQQERDAMAQLAERLRAEVEAAWAALGDLGRGRRTLAQRAEMVRQSRGTWNVCAQRQREETLSATLRAERAEAERDALRAKVAAIREAIPPGVDTYASWHTLSSALRAIAANVTEEA